MVERTYLGVDWGKRLEGAPQEVIDECDKFISRFKETHEADEKDTKEKMKTWMLDMAAEERRKHMKQLEKGQLYLAEYYKPNIDFSQIDPYWRVVETEKDKIMWHYFRYVIATIPHRGTIGRQIHLFLWDRTSDSVLGICRISSPTIAMKCRDDFFSMKQEHKVNGMLNHIASCDVIMPLQPFGYYTGGKLMSMMLSTRDIVDIYERAYKHKIVGLETTSIYGECFIKGTKVLTNKGFKNIEDINVEDVVLSVNNNFQSEWKKVTHKKNRRLKDNERVLDIQTVNGQSVSVTPNHHMIRINRNDNTRRKNKTVSRNSVFFRVRNKPELLHIEHCEAKELKKGDFLLLPNKARYDSHTVDEIIIPFDYFNNRTREGNYKQKDFPDKFNMGDWSEFLGWYVSEGSCDINAAKTFIAQEKSVNPENFDRIERLLKRLQIPYSNYNDRGLTILYKPLSIYLSQECGNGSDNKKIPDAVYNSQEYIIERFLESYGLGDGHKRKNTIKYTTKSQILSEQLVQVALRLGVRYRVVFDDNDCCYRIHYLYNRQYMKHINDCEITEIKSIINTEYNDVVYDITVEDNHTIAVGNTTELLFTGQSIQYDRLEHWKFLGLTQGFGTLQYSGISIGKIYEWLYDTYKPSFKKTEKTLRQVQAIGSLLGFPSKIASSFAIHGLRRGIYCSSLVDDHKGYYEYKKKLDELIFTNRTASDEAKKWKERWFQRRWDKYADERHKYSLSYYVPIELNNKTQTKLGAY